MLNYQVTQSNGQESILFIHGIGASSWMWWQQLPAFSDYKIITVDLPGHGKSAHIPWTSLAATADLIAEHVLQDRIVHVVGLSLGGHVALELAKRYPEKIMSTFVTGITVKPMSFQFLIPLQSRLVQKQIHNTSYLRELAHDYYQLPSDKIAEFIENYQLLTKENYETIWKEIAQFHLDGSYESIAKPCLIAAGSQESSGILDSIQIAPKIIPSAEGHLIPNAHHAWPVQNATLFNQILRDWLLHYNRNNDV